MTDHPRIVAARARALAARARLRGTAYEAKARLSPAAVADRAIESAKDRAMQAVDQGVEGVRKRPVLIGVFVTAAAMLLTRAPIRRLIARASQPRGDTSVTDPSKSGDRGKIR